MAAFAFGLAPALRAVAGNLVDKLRDRGSDSGGVRGNKLRTTLAIIEVTLSLVLLIGARLMVRSFSEIQKGDPGFDANNVVTLGASSRDVVRLILGQGMAVAGIGILLGLGGAIAAGVPVLLLAVTAVASFLPARRASGIDPVTALREE